MSLVSLHTSGGVATVTLDSPHNRNALSSGLIQELLTALAAAAADEAVRVVVLTHTGPVFCSGADLKETVAANATGEPPINRLGEVLTAIWECPKPVVAKLKGPARAGGLGLVAAADIAVCPVDTTFAFSEVRIGVVPAVISSTVLPRLSSRAAAELFLTGSVFDGARAAEIGLVTACVPVTSVDEKVDAYIFALVRGGPAALAGTKHLLRRQKSDTFRDEVAELTKISLGYFGSEEGIEGIAAYQHKRDPNWIPSAID